MLPTGTGAPGPAGPSVPQMGLFSGLRARICLRIPATLAAVVTLRAVRVFFCALRPAPPSGKRLFYPLEPEKPAIHAKTFSHKPLPGFSLPFPGFRAIL